jgi:hypothetical protein
VLIKKIFNYSLLAVFYAYLTGCSSVSSDTALKISSKQEVIAGAGCVEAKSSADMFDRVKWARGLLSPAVTVAATALAPVVLGVNAVLDYADHSNASQMKQACDLPPTAKEEMLKEVALNSGISVAIGSVDLGLGAEVSEVQQTFSVYTSD